MCRKALNCRISTQMDFAFRSVWNNATEEQFHIAGHRRGKHVSRPAFSRKKGELGIYLELYEAIPEEGQRQDSQQLFLSNVARVIAAYLQQLDVVLIKGKFERLGILNGIIINCFNNDLVMAVAPNSVENMDALVQLHLDGCLTYHIQTVFATKDLLRHTRTSKLRFAATLWEDEYRICRDEVKDFQNLQNVQPLSATHHGCVILSRIKNYQIQLVAKIGELRQMEMALEDNISNIIGSMQKIIPRRQRTIKTLGQFLEIVRRAIDAATDIETPKCLQSYLKMLREGRQIVKAIEYNICFPLELILSYCETSHQGQIKEKIHFLTKKSYVILHDISADISDVIDEDWATKIPVSLHGLFLRPLSILAKVTENVIEIDALTDQYISAFPDKIHPL